MIETSVRWRLADDHQLFVRCATAVSTILGAIAARE
jgi:hypothetical protein